MKLIPLIGCCVGGVSFLFAAITAVTGPATQIERANPEKERIERIERMANEATQTGGAGGCCQKKTEAPAEQSGQTKGKPSCGTHENCR